ncbi:MAG TPA: enoyl-CoA hydratase-related protein [Polyangiaceae bacterium]|nr:enoyl-CoA hydratase-related protein [Polyangiaceae bacterium]
MTDGIRWEKRGSAAIVVLDRPDRMNALTRASVAALGQVGRELAQDPELRAVILTGAGSRAFCAGADLRERASMSESEILAMLESYRTELRWLGESSRPTVAAINGVALGGGLELALACDFRIANEDAVLGLPETSLGIIPGAGGTQRLPRLIGPARAREMILLGRRLTAPEALAWGLVHRVNLAPLDLIEAALEFIKPILDGAPLAQAAALRALRQTDSELETGLEVELDAYRTCLASEDRKEALRAFQEKRKPIFRGC